MGESPSTGVCNLQPKMALTFSWSCAGPSTAGPQAACCPRQPRAGHSHHVSPWQRGHHIVAWGQHSHGEGTAACAGSSNFFFCPVIKWKNCCYIDWVQAGGLCQPTGLAADAGTNADISAHQVLAGPAVNALLAPCSSPAAQSGIAQGHPITVL